MLSKVLLAVGLGVSGLALPAVATPVEAATQITVWKHTGTQTGQQYYQPSLPSLSNYVSPTNYADGPAYLKLQILTKPSDLFVTPAICFWRHGVTNFQYETCAGGTKYGFSKTGTYYFQLNPPNKLWKKNGVYDWSKKPDLGRIMIRKSDGDKSLLMETRCGAACYTGDDLYDHVPIKISSELIFVAKGKTLTPPTDWRSGCPSAWSSLCTGGATPPPPTSPSTTNPPATTVPSDTVPEITVTPNGTSLNVRHVVDNGSKYQLTYKQASGGSTTWVTPTTSTTQTISGLKANTDYIIRVRALIEGTWREWGQVTARTGGASATTTTPTTAPPTTAPPTTAPPTTSVGTNSLTVDVTPASTSLSVTHRRNGASKYQMTYQPAGGKRIWTDPTTSTTQTITGLSPSTRHIIRVRPLVNGSWRDWVEVTATTLSTGGGGGGGGSTGIVTKSATNTLPSLTLDPGDRSILATWFHQKADLYQLRVRAAGGTWQWFSPSTATSRNITTLTNGRTYEVKVRGYINGVWEGWQTATATAGT